MDYSNLIAANLLRWNEANILPHWQPAVASVAQRLFAVKSRYETVAGETSVPWFIIAVIHERESSQSWTANIAQGDPWNAMSIHVPRGRGPFNSWEDAAVDALTNCAPQIADWPDWTAGGALTALESYNGLGYYNRGVPSPYVWSATDRYTSGKYVADGHYDPDAVDSQIGCAALILQLKAIDSTVQFDGGNQ